MYSPFRLDSGFTLRLGDGALMSDFYPECYHVVYGAQRPVRWSALETLQGGLCTLPSNVVSVCVCLQWCTLVVLSHIPYVWRFSQYEIFLAVY